MSLPTPSDDPDFRESEGEVDIAECSGEGGEAERRVLTHRVAGESWPKGESVKDKDGV